MCSYYNICYKLPAFGSLEFLLRVGRILWRCGWGILEELARLGYLFFEPLSFESSRGASVSLCLRPLSAPHPTLPTPVSSPAEQ